MIVDSTAKRFKALKKKVGGGITSTLMLNVLIDAFNELEDSFNAKKSK